LDETSYLYYVGVDGNSDGRIDKDGSGKPITRAATVVEPWTNISADGTVDPFPTVGTLTGDPELSSAKNANWNQVGAKQNTLDEAQSSKNEGVYRLKTIGSPANFHARVPGHQSRRRPEHRPAEGRPVRGQLDGLDAQRKGRQRSLVQTQQPPGDPRAEDPDHGQRRQQEVLFGRESEQRG